MKRILFIDDNKEILDIVNYVLTAENYLVRCYNSAAGFMSVVEEFSPDLILLEFKLKGGNGGEICLALKQDAKYSAIPVILVTAYRTPDLDFSRFNCNAVIDKPFDLDSLLDVVKKWIDPLSA
jgi:DNA-binding response OmpR family regulator